MPRIVILDPIAPAGLQLLDAAEDIQYDVQTGLTGPALQQALANADGAICRSGVKLDADSLQGGRLLKAIVRAGVGTDNIDKQAATRQGVVVMNTPTGNTYSTAEHTFALILALSRNVVPAYQSLCDGRWDRKEYIGTQLADKTLGIIGLGKVGQEVAKRAQAFQMRVVGYDPFLSSEQATRLGLDLVTNINEMLPEIDYLTVHTPLTPETRYLIGAEEIELLKPGARLINCARGGIYDEAALVTGLQSGKLAGVALDVYEQEPCTDSPLFNLPGVLCTPHLGASTDEAQTQVSIEAVQLLLAFLRTGEIRHAVNVASVDPATLAAMGGYLDLAFRLGIFLSQWHPGRADACRLEYRGEVTQEDLHLLTASFCSGLLEQAMSGDVNIVNAEVLIRERGIQLVEEAHSEMGAFSSSITAELTGDGESHLASATLFGNNMSRLIRLGSYRLETYLDGNMLLFTHDDVPGIIGIVGSILGDHQVNIAQMTVGRPGEQPGGTAIGALNLDTAPPAAAISQLSEHPSIRSVQVIQLPLAGQTPPWLPQ
ncbi:MAG TPA: phosphoglycerate dehydrogenase [Planctomycetes bacterium]|nr:phosphoglycerate dehydrogenase [Planctomycetaceae bacterium]HIN94047.1 phosphoglycerate dehydrogenase [Planctomycetota bacterium]